MAGGSVAADLADVIGDTGGRAGTEPPLMLEARAGLELAALAASPVYYGVGVPRGDGSSVLAVPGFMSWDAQLAVLGGWLLGMGYTPHAAALWPTGGSPLQLVGLLRHRAEAVAAAARAPITLIGHSLGGVLARAVTQLRPELVRHVVTLGAPVRADPRAASRPLVRGLNDLLLRDAASAMAPARLEREWARLHELSAAPLPAGVRSTSVYTREDPVVDWRACIDAAPGAAAHAVPGTHFGLAWNARVYALLGRLLPATSG